MVRLLKTYQCLVTSVMLFTLLSSCTASDIEQTNGSPENAVSEPTPASSLGLNADSTVPPDGASTPTNQTGPHSTPTLEPTTPDIERSPNPSESSTEADPASTSLSDQITVTIYRIDGFCQDFIPEPIRVESERAMEQAIGKVLASEDNREFELAGYRLQVDAANGEATVDLRLSPNSPRKIVSLSTCEQLALFGSLRETLLGNPEWNIETVRFTERGREIVL